MPVISIRASDEWLAMVDAEAERRQWSRNAAIVNILWMVLDAKKETETPPAASQEPRKPRPKVIHVDSSKAETQGSGCKTCGALVGHQKWCKR